MEPPAFPLIHIFLWKSSGLHVGSLWMVFRTNFLIFSHVDNLQIFQIIQESFQHPYSRPEIHIPYYDYDGILFYISLKRL